MQACIGKRLQELWPVTRGDIMLGIGYVVPYFEAYLSKQPVLIAVPAQQGAAYWPANKPGRIFLTHESALPLRESSVNRVLLLHSIENSEQLSWMMEEAWRVLTPGGRVLAVVPNRIGFWSRSGRSPFGYGRPFNMAQLRDLLESHQFVPMRASSTLFIPPLRLRFLWRLNRSMEWVAKWLRPPFGGVLLLEAEKQVYASIRQPVAAPKAYPSLMPKPVMGKASARPRKMPVQGL